MTLPELMEQLGRARKASQDAYEAYKMHKSVEDDVRADLDARLRSEGLRSAKNDDYIASIATKPVIKVVDERAALDWVRHQPGLETDLYIGLKKTAFDGLARMALKTNGELVPGVEFENNEYLTIKEIKKGE